jgi:hypothetical protein
MAPSRPSKAACLDGFSASIGCVDSLGPSAFPQTDVFDPSERVDRADADWVVDSRAGLLDALDDHAPGDVVWIDDLVDVGDAERIPLEDVTLASGYGDGDAVTGALRTEEKPAPLFYADDDVRVTGLRIHGDEFDYFDPADRYPDADKPIYEVGDSAAIFVRGDDVELDNLELSGWTYAGVSVRREGRDDVRTHVHHVDVVDNPAESLGYGVTVVEGRPLVELSYFDNNRHSIAGSGWEHCGYVVRFNVVGDFHSSHAIDMHGDRVEGREHPIAGRRIRIYNNVVKHRRSHVNDAPSPAIKIRGRPLERADVVGNWFFRERRVDNESNAVPIRQLYAPRDSFRNVHVSSNEYGVDRDPEAVAVLDDDPELTPQPAPDDVRPSNDPDGSTDSTLLGYVRRLFGGG